ncbi:hypothetical protein O7627_36345 [Solwaraspora sp. WMMD1047]|uniref:hypothetical protein n=1 Tax=Solwaraspora sp. WMMD1047 TaxID=3016102 RepID=UPI0024164CFF|nr:hypothetical protein [Solwaraspora sp. WMMD1047]MDG4834740.1 hypothetical protein [Solwaraspora sp. WMMD1047]
MTGGQFREVDPDLLADYVGGALTGTPAEATVDRLIAEDPSWERAYAELVHATDAVRVDLAGWAAVPEPMPADIADRLTAALRAEIGPTAGLATSAPTRLGTQPAASTDTEDTAGLGTARTGAADRGNMGAADTAVRTGVGGADDVAEGGVAAPDRGVRPGRRPASGVPEQSRPGGARNRGAARNRRRWSRLAGPVAVAAAVAAFAGFGVSRLMIPDARDGGSVTSQSDSGPESASDAGAAEVPRTLVEPSPQLLLSSGTDYTAPGLAAAAKGMEQRTGGNPPSRAAAPDAGTDNEQYSATDRSPAELARLTDRAALSGCLDAVAEAHARGPLTVEVVDYATFEGTPALILRFVDATGVRWAMAAGPACGLPGSGADTRYRTQVG